MAIPGRKPIEGYKRQVKRFFAENGKALAVGVILGVGALIGGRYWNSHQVDSARSASLAYQNAVTAVSEGKPDSIPAAEKFAAENKNTYGALASLELEMCIRDSAGGVAASAQPTAPGSLAGTCRSRA